MDDRRAALTRLQEELPKRTEELRGKLTTEELRKAAEEFFEDATETYNTLVPGVARRRWCAPVARLSSGARPRQGYVERAVELTQEALGNVSAQTRAVRERAAKLVGAQLPAAKKAPAKKAPAKKAPAKEGSGQEGRRQEGPAKRSSRRPRPRRSPRSKFDHKPTPAYPEAVMLPGCGGCHADVVFWAVLAANIFAFVHAAYSGPTPIPPPTTN